MRMASVDHFIIIDRNIKMYTAKGIHALSTQDYRMLRMSGQSLSQGQISHVRKDMAAGIYFNGHKIPRSKDQLLNEILQISIYTQKRLV